MKVYYIRHAEPNYDNHDDVARELSPKGMEDRKLVKEFLIDKHIDVALSSPYSGNECFALFAYRDMWSKRGCKAPLLFVFPQKSDCLDEHHNFALG